MRLLSWLSVCAVAWATASACQDNPITVTEERFAQGVRLYAETRDGMDLTVTLTAELQNMSSQPALPATVDLRGRGRRLLAELRVANPAQAWRWRYNYYYRYGNRGGRPDDTTYLLPYPAGENYLLLQGNFGKFSHGPGSSNEHAFDFTMPEGATICAARDGVVAGVRVDSSSGGAHLDFKSCGNYVIIRHDDGTYAEYLHLQQNGALVKVGDRVRAGQPIARSGNTGYSTTPHLHFVVFRPIDGMRRETLPIKFRIAGASGPVTLAQGKFYRDGPAVGDKRPEPAVIAHGQRIVLGDHLAAGRTTVFHFDSPGSSPSRAYVEPLKQLHAARADLAVVRVATNRPGMPTIDWNSPVIDQFALKSLPHFKVFGPDGALVAEGEAARALVDRWIAEPR